MQGFNLLDYPAPGAKGSRGKEAARGAGRSPKAVDIGGYRKAHVVTQAG